MSSVKNSYTDKKGKNAIIDGTLYLVATPIGNMSDISERAIKVLSEVDFIAAEDTRNSAKLLSILGIKSELVSYFEHNKRRRGEEIVARLQNGESCALITDAGMPAISDPGADIVALCAEQGITVTCVPGCCAAVTALALSGLDTGRFTFEGFLSTSKNERKSHLEEISHLRRTLIIYEAPHKLRTTLDDLISYLGNRKIALCRELTKINEEIMRTTIEAAIEHYKENEPRGEYVLIIEGAKENEESDAFWSKLSPEEHVAYYCNNCDMQKMDAIKQAARDRAMPKSEFYKLLIK